MQFNDCVQWRLAGCPDKYSQLDNQPDKRITMTKHPTKRKVAIDNIIHDYNAPYLHDALARFAV